MRAMRADRRRGVVVIDKPSGMTSFEVVKAVRRHFGGVKAGHTGTLDPLATGVLPICLGEATRIASLLLAEDKRYETSARLGLVTDTLDVEGTTLVERDPTGVDADRIERELAFLTGTLQQVPPAFSAVRCGGRRAHELARRGEKVELAARTVVVHQLSLLAWRPPLARLFVHCSKGTYVRSLVSELGERLGCGAAVAALRRVQSGCFTLQQSVTLDELARMDADEVPLITLDQALVHLEAVQIDEDGARAFGQGQRTVVCEHPREGLVRVRLDSVLVGLAEVREGRLHPRRVFDADRWRGASRAEAEAKD
jgi:tRNA pseudouridine55 synthase